MSTRTVTTTEVFPDLLAMLQEHFTLTPNYARELDGRVVDTRFDPWTGDEVPVTDHEVVWLRLFGMRSGPRIRQTWDWWAGDRTRMRFNKAFEGWNHLGVQYASACRSCGVERWNNADRPAVELCKKCRTVQEVPSARCPEFGFACSTAYIKHQCRCADCRAWNTAKHRRLRETRRAHNSSLVLQQTTTQIPTPDFPVVGSCRTNEELHPEEDDSDGPADWTWLPDDVRALLWSYGTTLAEVLTRVLVASQSGLV